MTAATLFSSGQPRRRTTLVFAAVALLAVAIYARTAAFGFAFDDVSEVVRNEYIRSLGNLSRIFASGAWDGAGERNAIYRPLTSATYALNYAIGGLSPLGYHVVNILLHAAVSCLVLLLAGQLGLSLGASALAAALFAIHPVHVEVVANVAGRKDLLATGFVIAAVLAHLRGRRTGTRGWATAALAATAAALFSKESGAAALGLVFAADLVFNRREASEARRRPYALYALYAVLFCLYLWARYTAVGSLGVPLDKIPYAENPAAHATTWVRILTAVAVLGRGLLLLVFPYPLSPDYSYDAIALVTSVFHGPFVGSLLLLTALASGALLCRKRYPLATFAAAWYFIAVFPASNLLVPVGTIFGDRLLYLPSVGFCLAAAAGFEQLRARPIGRWAWGIAAAVLLALGAKTLSYSAVWSDEVSLFRAAVEAEGRSGKAHQLLGEALMEEGRAPKAVHELETAASILSSTPEFPAGQLIELGVAYERLGRWEEAEKLYERVLERKPDYPDALWRLGVVAWAQGRRGESVRLWQRTVAVAPDHARALSDLGLAAQAAGDLPQAEALWTRAVRADPNIAGPWMWLGNLYAQRGDIVRARAAWTQFLENARYGVFPREREIIAERLRRTDPQAGRHGGP